MCMDSTLTTRFSRTRMTIPGYLISFLLGWPYRLTSPVCSQSSNVAWGGRDVEIQSNLSERKVPLQYGVFWAYLPKTNCPTHLSHNCHTHLSHTCPTQLSHKCPTHLSHKCPIHLSHKCPIPISHYVLTSHLMCEILNIDVPVVLVLPHSTHNDSNEGQPNALTCILIQQTSWLSWCLQIWTDHVLPRSTSGIMTGVSPISDILPQVADHECCYDLRCTSADTVCGVWTKLKSTITLYFHCITNVWSTRWLNYY